MPLLRKKKTTKHVPITPRTDSLPPWDPIVSDDLCDAFFSVELFHGGVFVQKGCMRYFGGTMDSLLNCEWDRWSLQEITAALKDDGYKGYVKIYLSRPEVTFEHGLYPVKDEVGASLIAKAALNTPSKKARVCVLSGCPVGEGVMLTPEDATNKPTELHDVEVEMQGDTEGGQAFDLEVDEECTDNQETDGDTAEDDEWDNYSLENSDDDCKNDGFGDYVHDLPPDLKAIYQEAMNQEAMYQDELDDATTHAPSQDKKRKAHEKSRESATTSSRQRGVPLDTPPPTPPIDFGDEEELLSGPDSEDLHSGEDSDLESRRKGVFRYNHAELGPQFKFKLGMEFLTKEDFKDAVREVATLHGWGLRFKKNDNMRVRVCYKDGCEWVCYCGKVGQNGGWVIKTLKDKHTCSRVVSGRMASRKWVSKKLVKAMNINRNVPLKNVIDEVKQSYRVDISGSKAVRAKRLAKVEVEGIINKQYSQLYDYCAEIRRANIGSTTIIKTEASRKGEEYRHFQRLYMSLRPVLDGFLHACRPLIGLDGCFLKGTCGGILLVAVGRDPNDQYFPIAYAVVESENKDSWSWFLELLLADIGRDKPWVIISDQQKGLVPVIEELSGLEHRLCVRHIYANMKRQFGGSLLLRDKLLSASKATYMKKWEEEMKQLAEINKPAHDWLLSHPPRTWAKSHFSEWSRSDLIMNNISEAFNGRIVDARELPIISMLNWLRGYLMCRFAKNRILCAKYREKSKICPRPRKRLDKHVVESAKWRAVTAGYYKYEVRSASGDQFVVDIGKRECSCRLWDLCGLPCPHGVAAIYEHHADPHDYVDECYWVGKYEECYAPLINPINGQNLWETVTGMPKIIPPRFRVPIGRPKKARRREKDEPVNKTKFKRSNTSLICSNCGKYGHNKRTCKAPPKEPVSNKGKQGPTSANTEPQPSESHCTSQQHVATQPSLSQDYSTLPPTPFQDYSTPIPVSQPSEPTSSQPKMLKKQTVRRQRILPTTSSASTPTKHESTAVPKQVYGWSSRASKDSVRSPIKTTGGHFITSKIVLPERRL